jgi:hypothetical protein
MTSIETALVVLLIYNIIITYYVWTLNKTVDTTADALLTLLEAIADASNNKDSK